MFNTDKVVCKLTADFHQYLNNGTQVFDFLMKVQYVDSFVLRVDVNRPSQFWLSSRFQKENKLGILSKCQEM